MRYGQKPPTQEQTAVSETCIDKASSLPNSEVIRIISWLFQELSQRVDDKADVDYLVHQLSLELNEELEFYESALPKYFGRDYDENDPNIEKDDEILKLLASIDMLYKWRETPVYKTMEQAVNQGHDFSEVMDSLIDPEALGRLETLIKI